MQAAPDTHLAATKDPVRYLRNDLLMTTDVYAVVKG